MLKTLRPGLRGMRFLLLSCTCAALLLAPSAARADGFITPYVGTLFGGTLGDFDVEERPYTFGVSFGSMGGGIFGFEADLAFSPDFLGDSDSFLIGDTSVTTAMANVLIGAPMGGQSGAGVRPYAAAGVGAIRQQVEAFGDFLEFTSTDFGYNLGGGVMFFFGQRGGIRADFRYFRNFQKSDEGLFDLEPGTFSFSRATVGAVLRF
jgi:opacity protein-like surface antigen